MVETPKQGKEKKTYSYPDDFKDWKPLGPPCQLFLGRYLVLESPDGKRQALIHLEDNDVAGVMDMVDGRDVYSHPSTLIGARRIFEVLKAQQETFDALYGKRRWSW